MPKPISFIKIERELQQGNYHLSKTKIDKLQKIKQISRTKKPKGLWYSTNKWITHDIHTDKQKQNICCYIYKVKIKKSDVTSNINDTTKSKILQIKTIKQLDAFIGKYEYKNPKTYYKINWRSVSRDFKGIEFKPYINLSKIEKEKKIISMEDYIINKFNKKRNISQKQLDDNWDYYYNIYYKEYYSTFITKYGFYDTIDIDSGCIWDTSILDIGDIDDIELLYKKNNNKWFIN
jgi:hypothetical protein